MLLWHTTRNGYQPLRAFAVLAVLWAISFGLFQAGQEYALMGPTDRVAFAELAKGDPLSGSYPRFNAAVYAIDISLPIISLGERDKWQPLASPLVTPAPQGVSNEIMKGEIFANNKFSNSKSEILKFKSQNSIY